MGFRHVGGFFGPWRGRDYRSAGQYTVLKAIFDGQVTTVGYSEIITPDD